MKNVITFLFLLFFTVIVKSQDCSILSKANNISPDKLCSPVTATWNVTYTGVNNAGTPVQIRYVWGDGTTNTIAAMQTAPGVFQATLPHTYTSQGKVCNYKPTATLIVNGVACTSSSQQQIVTVWDDDDHNGGIMRISPAVYPICVGNSANVRFRDVTQFNCVPPQEKDVPNLFTRWVQWEYGTSITMTGLPVRVNNLLKTFPYRGPVVMLPGPVTGSGVYSDVINVANDKMVGQYWQITLRNWNYCNPYDDPNIPGPPVDLVNGDHPAVVTTAIILIVAYPDATITPIDTLCVDKPAVTLTAKDAGGTWSGPGVSGNKFTPSVAGVGNHIIKYSITNSSGCKDEDLTTITVVPLPNTTITPVLPVCYSDTIITLTGKDPGGVWTGPGVSGNTFNVKTAGVGNHTITYTIVDKNGCTSTSSTVITVLYSPDATITPVDTMCINSPRVTLISKDLGGVWTGDGVIGNVFDPAYAGAGNHIIKYFIMTAGGCTDEDQITITVIPLPITTITPIGPLCIGDTIVVLEAQELGGTWSGPGVVGNTFSPKISGVGNHTIKYSKSNQGCYSESTTTILVLPTPDATIVPVDTVCVSSPPVILQAKDAGGVWTGLGVVGSMFVPQFAGVGNHVITYTINGFVCSDVDQITITVTPIPIVNITPVGTLLINSSNVTLQGTPIGGTFSGTGVENGMFKPALAGVGTHVVTYTIAPDRFGCQGIDTTHIKVMMPPPPIAKFEPDTVGCAPLPVQFRNLSVNGESYLWDFGDKSFSLEKNPLHVYNVAGEYIVRLYVSNVAGQSMYKGLIKVYPKPIAALGAYPTTVTNNEQVVVFMSYSTLASLYKWDFGDGQFSGEKDPFHKYETPGEYNVVLQVTSIDGCVDTALLNTPVIVDWKLGFIKYPNAFKWNGTGPTGGYWTEGLNEKMDEIFRPHFENVIEYKLQIFNRWGVLIYESLDLQKGWDGYDRGGNLAVQGVYVWKVVARFTDGTYYNKVGDVTFLH